MPHTFPFDLGQGGADGADRLQRLLYPAIDLVVDLATLARRCAARTRQRRTLRGLDDRLLADIGVSRAVAEREAGKWFWR